MVAPDDTTFAYVEGRPHAEGRRLGSRARRMADLPSDSDASYDTEVELDATQLRPT